jgi:hypothetical protein
MKHVIAILIMLSGVCLGDEIVKDINWQTINSSGTLAVGELVDNCLRLENTSSQAKTFNILTMEAPGITEPSYGIRGRVRYDNVQGNGYIEMWNHFSGGKSYFSRTMAPSGPMGLINGSSDWRDFNIGFMVRDASGWLSDRPEKLQFNLMLPGKGTVYISNIQLMQQSPRSSSVGSWWAAKVASFGGVTLGILGFVVGNLARRGRAKRFVMLFLYFATCFGVINLITGVVAIFCSQPYAIYYPLLLLGGISIFVCGLLIIPVKKRYEAIELRKISSMDS